MALLCIAFGLAACGLGQAPPLPTEPPPAPSALDLREGARLQREAIRALNPPRGPRDPERAAALVEAAAQRGDPDAQMLLAAGYLFGPEGTRDPAAAIPWLHRAAQQGHAEAQYRLARLLEAGEGTRREAYWAALWFQRAAERGHPDAHFALGLLQVLGEGTARDEAEALARVATAERAGIRQARRYAAALRQRVPPRQARAAEARVRSETARGAVTPVDRPLVRFVQSGLSALGAWDAPVDGRDNAATRAALEAFARREGLSPARGPYDTVVQDRLRNRLAER